MKKLLLAFSAVLFLMPAKAEEKCHLYRVVTLDMLPGYSGVVVPAAIGDAPLHMQIDTGGYVTAFAENKVQELGLPVDVHPGSGISLLGGIVLRRFVTLSDFRIGTLKTRSLTYPMLPSGFLPPGVDGLLSPDLIANFDLDLDFANGKASLFSPDHCDGKIAWWTTQDQLTAIPITRDDALHISMKVNLDGEEIKAVIDTGASRTVMSMDTAERLFDLKEEDLKDAPGVNKIGGAKKAHFKKLSFGNVDVLNPDITLIPDSAAGVSRLMPKLIIGISVLRQLHLYIAYKEKVMYLTAASAHR
jgi:Predicted aspartyl protease